MNKSMLVGAVLGAVGVTAGGAVATYSLVNKGPEYAQVTDVQPIKQQVKTPREVCKDVAVTRQAPVKDQHQIAGTAIGAVVGLIGGVKVYGKFSSGDPDTSKTAASWFGACIFLIVAATILRSFFL